MKYYIILGHTVEYLVSHVAKILTIPTIMEVHAAIIFSVKVTK
jgi:hypothetical protein